MYLFFEVACRALEINSKIFTAVLGPHLLRCLKNSPFLVVNQCHYDAVYYDAVYLLSRYIDVGDNYS